ncbi:hypothetical protein SNR37_003175 [Agarivorans aestuarii]|uniref:Uncharacterized protein n=1 Tax=Agarivorans aestuarii TaxID=1563703 RepID=A0ABU7G330_9ALTE|nr:hypothetical protein [Agarivorans aestuarii]MEE1673748.1 hypothetical protein [Agarivorans aestuarii]
MSYKYWTMIAALTLPVVWLLFEEVGSSSYPEQSSRELSGKQVTASENITLSEQASEQLNTSAIKGTEAPLNGSAPPDAQLAGLKNTEFGPSNQPQSAWSVIEYVPKQYLELERESVDRRFVSFDGDALQSLTVGESFEMLLPQLDRTFMPVVDSIQLHDNGDRTISGSYEVKNGKSYQVTFTIGHDGLFATLATPQDVYFMQGHSNQAWLISGRDQDSLKSWGHDDGVAIPQKESIQPPTS